MTTVDDIFKGIRRFRRLLYSDERFKACGEVRRTCCDTLVFTCPAAARETLLSVGSVRVTCAFHDVDLVVVLPSTAFLSDRLRRMRLSIKIIGDYGVTDPSELSPGEQMREQYINKLPRYEVERNSGDMYGLSD